MSEFNTPVYRTILYVFLALAVLTGIEYMVGLLLPSAVFLFILALIKGSLVVYFFMHVYRLWRQEEAH